MPSVGVNADGMGEVFRLNLEVGRFMKGYEVDVGGDDFNSTGGGALQGGINVGGVNVAAIAEESHNLLAFGTSIGTVEFWDHRSRSRVGILSPPSNYDPLDVRPEVTALQFDPSGLTLASGSSTGLIHLYDLRSPIPILKKDQGYGYPIQTLTFLNSSSSTSRNAHLSSEPKILSADKRIIKIWNERTGDPWTSVEPAVDLHCVEWCKDSGMLLTANEGRQQHSFFIPQLGPAPKWCSFLDNLVEEMAEDPTDPASFTQNQAGAVYDNYKFLSVPQLRALNLDHLVGQTGLLRPYMHGYFVAQQLYEEARLISNPEMWQEQRQKSIREKIDKERESRIRGSKKSVAVKVNKKLAERVLEREEKNDRRKAKRALEKGLSNAAAAEDGEDEDEPMADGEGEGEGEAEGRTTTVLNDPRFAALFADEDFTVDETSHEFRALNPSTVVTAGAPASSRTGKRLTAVEEEELEGSARGVSASDASSSDDDDEDDNERSGAPAARPQQRAESPDYKRSNRISTSSYRKTGHVRKDALREREREREAPRMQVSSSAARPQSVVKSSRNQSFGARAAQIKPDARRANGSSRSAGGVVGEKHITFAPSVRAKQNPRRGESGASDTQERSVGGGGGGRGGRGGARGGRRSASGNTFRNL